MEQTAETRHKRACVNKYPPMMRIAAAKEVYNAYVILAIRFAFTGHLVAANLFDSAIIATFINKFTKNYWKLLFSNFCLLRRTN